MEMRDGNERWKNIVRSCTCTHQRKETTLYEATQSATIPFIFRATPEYLPIQDQKVIQQTARIFLGNLHAVFTMVVTMVRAPGPALPFLDSHHQLKLLIHPIERIHPLETNTLSSTAKQVIPIHRLITTEATMQTCLN